jgi:hypothetical protein
MTVKLVIPVARFNELSGIGALEEGLKSFSPMQHRPDTDVSEIDGNMVMEFHHVCIAGVAVSFPKMTICGASPRLAQQHGYDQNNDVYVCEIAEL